MRYAIASKTNEQALLTRLLSGPTAGTYGFAQDDPGKPVTYQTWSGAIKAAAMHGGKPVPAP